MTLYVLCKYNDVQENELKLFILKETEILVIKRNGKFNCLHGRCTHAGAPLSEGELQNGILQCPWHGSRFDVETGNVVRGPAKKPLRIYSCVVKNNDLLIEL